MGPRGGWPDFFNRPVAFGSHGQALGAGQNREMGHGARAGGDLNWPVGVLEVVKCRIHGAGEPAGDQAVRPQLSPVAPRRS